MLTPVAFRASPRAVPSRPAPMIATESPFTGLDLRDREPVRRDIILDFLVLRCIELMSRQPALRGRTLARGPIATQLHRFFRRVVLYCRVKSKAGRVKICTRELQTSAQPSPVKTASKRCVN